MAQDQRTGLKAAGAWMRQVLAQDSAYFRIAIVYGVAISLLSLATPISVQMLINSVANTALPTPLFTLSAILLVLLLFAVALSALRIHVMALFERRFFARIVAEITLRAVHAQNPFFQDARRGDLFNRFFDLITVQKAMPSLLVGGFTIVLQGAVGLVVTSFYHPFFLAFNVVLVLALFLVWRLLADGSVRSAVEVSHAKHATAHWLESVGGSNGFYQSDRHLAFAMDRSEAMTARYVAAHRRHFRNTFSQTLGLLLTYAFASAALLALGGWLIIQEQLSIGQLVAAELILSGVFYGVAQLGGYLDAFYDLVASLEELSLFWDLPQERPQDGRPIAPSLGDIRLMGVELEGQRFEFSLAAGEHVAAVGDPGVSRALSLLLKRHTAPERGLMTVGGADIGGFDMYSLRWHIRVIDRQTIVEMTIREYLSLAEPAEPSRIMAALETVGLVERIGQLPQGMDTPLSSSGWPLDAAEMIALKLAAALLARPRVLMLSSLCDLLPEDRLAAAVQALKTAGTTILHFTNHPARLRPDGWLWIGARRQVRCADLDELATLQRSGSDGDALSI